jgi:hypothetical protein
MIDDPSKGDVKERMASKLAQRCLKEHHRL